MKSPHWACGCGHLHSAFSQGIPRAWGKQSKSAVLGLYNESSLSTYMWPEARYWFSHQRILPTMLHNLHMNHIQVSIRISHWNILFWNSKLWDANGAWMKRGVTSNDPYKAHTWHMSLRCNWHSTEIVLQCTTSLYTWEIVKNYSLQAHLVCF